MFYKLINEYTIEKFKNPLRIDGKHVFTNSESVLNANGVYKYVEDAKPEITENQYLETYYYIEDNMIHKGYTVKEFEFIEEDEIFFNEQCSYK